MLYICRVYRFRLPASSAKVQVGLYLTGFSPRASPDLNLLDLPRFVFRITNISFKVPSLLFPVALLRHQDFSSTTSSEQWATSNPSRCRRELIIWDEVTMQYSLPLCLRGGARSATAKFSGGHLYTVGASCTPCVSEYH